jgi:hypothetical protein
MTKSSSGESESENEEPERISEPEEGNIYFYFIIIKVNYS